MCSGDRDPVRAVPLSDYICRVQELRAALALLEEVRPVIGSDDLDERVEDLLGAIGDV